MENKQIEKLILHFLSIEPLTFEELHNKFICSNIHQVIVNQEVWKLINKNIIDKNNNKLYKKNNYWLLFVLDYGYYLIHSKKRTKFYYKSKMCADWQRYLGFDFSLDNLIDKEIINIKINKLLKRIEQ